LTAEPPPKRVESPNWLPRLTLGGAICGGLAGSFAGALLGAAIGAVSSNLSLGLDGALLGSAVAIPAGAAYGLIVALREKRQNLALDEDKPSP
jgi:uncharacterized membrane protein